MELLTKFDEIFKLFGTDWRDQPRLIRAERSTREFSYIKQAVLDEKYFLDVVLLGDIGVGKSSLLHYLLEARF